MTVKEMLTNNDLKLRRCSDVLASITMKCIETKHEEEVAALQQQIAELKEESASLKVEMQYYKRWFGRVE